ncbi:neuronal acetylcholine receptor subunit alpha-3-like [Ptychodera flava]|uniref:neuronal acetylcholine receptor subunit alpha-3-like n=1 Tax=Ptychodera flava TaxID=63121 RepID=UPI00396A6626
MAETISLRAVIFACLLAGVWGSLIEHRLQKDIFDGYNKHIRPVVQYNQTLILEFGLSITQILDVHEKKQVVITSCWAEQIWHDYRLEWDPSNYSEMDFVVVPSEWVWKPDVVLENSASGNYEIPDSRFVTIESDGSVYLTPPSIFEIPCTMDIQFFPFDVQHCQLHFGPWEYTYDQIRLQPMADTVIKGKYTENTEWHLGNATVALLTDYSDSDPDEAYSVLVYTLVLERRPLYYIINIVVPCLLMALLTLLVFCLHPDSGEKMTLSISILIAMSVFSLLVADIMPPTSETVPLIAQYVLFNMYLVAGSIVVSVTVLSLHHRQTYALRMHPWVRKLFLDIFPTILCMRPCCSGEKGQHSADFPISIQHLRDLRANEHQVYMITNAKLEDNHANLGGSRKNKSTAKGKGDANYKSNEDLSRTKDLYVLQKLLEEVIRIRRRAEQLETEKVMLDEWKYIAKVVDRLFLLLSLIVYIIGTIIMFTKPEMRYL